MSVAFVGFLLNRIRWSQQLEADRPYWTIDQESSICIVL